ncbi:MAG: mobile mystery protein B [Bacteroidia bacterium]
MGLNLTYGYGQTPIDEEEKEGLLISSITTREELDEFEQKNIENAIEWTLKRKFKKEKIFTEKFVQELHFQMFGNIWSWAGKFRHTNKNLGDEWQKVPVLLKQLNDDSLFWIQNKTYLEDEIAIRYKHRIVQIHCFSNGNGRHSRLIADVIVSHLFGKPVFTWGKTFDKNISRENYLKAIKLADENEFSQLLKFSRK